MPNLDLEEQEEPKINKCFYKIYYQGFLKKVLKANSVNEALESYLVRNPNLNPRLILILKE